MTDLLNCPFCGEQGDVWRSTGTDWYGNWFCGCSNQNCIAVGRPYGSGTSGQAHAIAAWNRRAPLSALPGETEVVGLIERLRSPVSMSQFATRTDLYMEVLQQRIEAAASLQAMQARAEAAKARVKELEEALERAEAEASKGLDTGDTREALIDIKFAARTALKGGSNG